MDDIKINIRDLSGQSITIEDKLSSDYLGLTKEDYVHFNEPLCVNALVNRADDSLISKVHVQGEFESFCSRSLDRVVKNWVQDFVLETPIEEGQEIVDIGDEIRQEVIVSLPLRVLSDAEAEKEKAENQQPAQREGQREQQQDAETYRPFVNLKEME